MSLWRKVGPFALGAVSALSMQGIFNRVSSANSHTDGNENPPTIRKTEALSIASPLSMVRALTDERAVPEPGALPDEHAVPESDSLRHVGKDAQRHSYTESANFIADAVENVLDTGTFILF